MRKFARRVLIILLCTILGGLAGVVYTFIREPAVYTSEAQLYVVPGDSEDMVRASDGGLKQDFAIVFKSAVVMDTVKSTLGTTEDIEDNLEVLTPANSNIIILRYSAETAQEAKDTVDVIARTAVRTTTIVPVSSISILQEGTLPEEAHHIHLTRYASIGAILGAAISFAVCILAALFTNAFRPKKEDEEKDMLYDNVLPRLKKLEQNSSQQVLLPGATEEAVAAAAAKIAPDDELVQYMKKRRKLHRSTESDALAGDDLEDDLLDSDEVDDDEIARAAKAAETAENEALMQHALKRHVAKAVAVANAEAGSSAEDDILADDTLQEEEPAQPAVKQSGTEQPQTARENAKTAARASAAKQPDAAPQAGTAAAKQTDAVSAAGTAAAKQPGAASAEKQMPASGQAAPVNTAVAQAETARPSADRKAPQTAAEGGQTASAAQPEKKEEQKTEKAPQAGTAAEKPQNADQKEAAQAVTDAQPAGQSQNGDAADTTENRQTETPAENVKEPSAEPEQSEQAETTEQPDAGSKTQNADDANQAEVKEAETAKRQSSTEILGRIRK
ncbi:MAG: Wzz/FepE/Etk N-terminal domain-containing protein [Lachnospiraceae bacterium]|jgi:capsular polysaccharide biosynthesis protein